MKIEIVTPSAASPRTGNRHTAQRYAAFLRSAGHRVRVGTGWQGNTCDLLIALHARKSLESVTRYRDAYPAGPLIVVLTGTDLYRDIRGDAGARRSLELADRLIVLQEEGLRELAVGVRRKTRVVYQSARAAPPHRPPARRFRISVIGHLRDEKDPFRAALALGHIDRSLPIEVVHLGDALDPEMEAEARRLMARDRRYRWLGGVPHARALGWLARSHALVVSSRMEGGANVICEAARARVPVLASRIAGNVGMLGKAHPGYYPLADTRALARLIMRAATEPAFYRALKRTSIERRRLFAPALERRGVLATVAEALSRQKSSA